MFNKATQLKLDVKYGNSDEVEALWKAIINLNKNSEFQVEIVEQPFNMEDMTRHYIQPHITEEIDCVDLIDNHHGIYIAQIFAQEKYVAMKGFGTWEGVTDEDLKILSSGPRPETHRGEMCYFETWDDVMQHATFTNNIDGRKFTLQSGEGAGDLFLVEVGKDVNI